MNVAAAQPPGEALKIIGYRLEMKFKNPEVENYKSTQVVKFEEALGRVRGLVLYHGGYTAAEKFINKWADALRNHRLVVLFFSSEGFASSVEECQHLTDASRREACRKIHERTDLLPYVHFLSYPVHNLAADEKTDPEIERRFSLLKEGFIKLKSMDDPAGVSELWQKIDPIYERMLVSKLKDFQVAIHAGPATNDTIQPEHSAMMRKYYTEADMPTYSKLREDYLALCRSFNLKKN